MSNLLCILSPIVRDVLIVELTMGRSIAASKMLVVVLAHVKLRIYLQRGTLASRAESFAKRHKALCSKSPQPRLRDGN